LAVYRVVSNVLVEADEYMVSRVSNVEVKVGNMRWLSHRRVPAHNISPHLFFVASRPFVWGSCDGRARMEHCSQNGQENQDGAAPGWCSPEGVIIDCGQSDRVKGESYIGQN